MELSGSSQRAARNVSHRIQTVLLQLLLVAPSHPPEIRQRTVIPEQSAVTHLVQFCNAHTISIRLYMFCHNIERHFAQIEIGSDPGGCRDARLSKDILYHFRRKFSRCHVVCPQIMCDIHKHLVDRIDMNILRRHITQIEIVNSGAVIHVERHARRCDLISQPLFRMPRIHFFYFLYDLKEPRSSRNAIGFQGRRYRQTDCLFRALGVCHHKVGRKRIQPTFHALYRCIERL